MSRLFQKLLRFVHRCVRPYRNIAAGETRVRGSAARTAATASGGALDAAAYRAAVAELPVQERELLELHQIDGLSFIEIAEAKGIAADEVEREIAAALGYLVIRLERDG